LFGGHSVSVAGERVCILMSIAVLVPFPPFEVGCKLHFDVCTCVLCPLKFPFFSKKNSILYLPSLTSLAQDIFSYDKLIDMPCYKTVCFFLGNTAGETPAVLDNYINIGK
jgi:hypothetical protein